MDRDFDQLIVQAESLEWQAWHRIRRFICRQPDKRALDMGFILDVFGADIPIISAIRQLGSNIEALREVDYEFDIDVEHIFEGAITIDGRPGRKGYIKRIDAQLLKKNLKNISGI